MDKNFILAILFPVMLVSCVGKEDKSIVTNVSNIDTVREYYSTGKIKSLYLKKDDQLNGPYLSYYENGYLKDSSFFEEGLIIGWRCVFNKRKKRIIYKEHWLNYWGVVKKEIFPVIDQFICYDSLGKIIQDSSKYYYVNIVSAIPPDSLTFNIIFHDYRNGLYRRIFLGDFNSYFSDIDTLKTKILGFNNERQYTITYPKNDTLRFVLQESLDGINTEFEYRIAVPLKRQKK